VPVRTEEQKRDEERRDAQELLTRIIHLTLPANPKVALGLTQREAGEVLGVDQATVSRDASASEPELDQGEPVDVDASASTLEPMPVRTEEQ
jgi:hypothetical protein